MCYARIINSYSGGVRLDSSCAPICRSVYWTFVLMIPHGGPIELFQVAAVGLSQAVVRAILSVRWCM